MMQKETQFQTTKLERQVSAKERNLSRIATSETPINPQHEAAHIRRVSNATQYLEELPEVKSLIGCGVPVKIVPLSKFQKALKAADISRIEFDGKFCKIAVYSFYSGGNQWLVAMAGISAL